MKAQKEIKIESSIQDREVRLIQDGDMIDYEPIMDVDWEEKETDGGYCQAVAEAIKKVLIGNNVEGDVIEFDGDTGQELEHWNIKEFKK